MMLETITAQAKAAAEQLLAAAKLSTGDIVVVGCSTSEVAGGHIGKNSVPELGDALAETMIAVCGELGLCPVFQCCEHLNRAVICERAAVPNAEPVNVVPFPKAGGSFATAAYAAFKNPAALEEIKADAGLDIGFTLIGMHLKKVAVPVRLKNDFIGSAKVLAARVRPKFIGGERAHYNSELL